jgi:hypothetical protein
MFSVDQNKATSIFIDASRTSSGAGFRGFIFDARIQIDLIEHAKVFAWCGIFIAPLWKIYFGENWRGWRLFTDGCIQGENLYMFCIFLN